MPMAAAPKMMRVLAGDPSPGTTMLEEYECGASTAKSPVSLARVVSVASMRALKRVILMAFFSVEPATLALSLMIGELAAVHVAGFSVVQ